MGSQDHETVAKALWPAEVPVRTLNCRHCGRKNRVSVKDAVFSGEACECGACRKPLFLLQDDALVDLSPHAYEHSLDRKSLEALQSLPGFPAATRWLLKQVGERSLRYLFMATYLRCSDGQFPELVALLDRARQRLDIPYRPELYLSEHPAMNAGAMGVESPLIMVHSALLDQLDDAEITAVLAHELGHLHSDHVLYDVLAKLILHGGAAFSGLSQLATLPIRAALAKWSRCSELTADRASLLGSRDLGAVLGLLMKFAGGNRPGTTERTNLELAPFIRQARDLADLHGASWLDSTLAHLLVRYQSHPFCAWRVLHLLQWVEQGTYLDILAGSYQRVDRTERLVDASAE